MNVLNSEVIGAFVAQWVEDSVGFNPTVRKAAASLTVGVGAMSDPEMHRGWRTTLSTCYF